MRILGLSQLYEENTEIESTEYKSCPNLYSSFVECFEDPRSLSGRRREMFFQDIKIIEKSLAGIESKRKSKRKSSSKPSLEKIQEETSTVVEMQVDSEMIDESRLRRDFSAIHRERALSCGYFSSDLNEARRFRQKKLSTYYRSRNNST